MTKAKLERLIALIVEEEAQTEWVPMKEAEAEELHALRAEFEAWEPEAAPPKRPDPNVEPVKLARIGKDY